MHFPIELPSNLKIVDIIIKNKKDSERGQIKQLSKSYI